jgi:glycosyltransferase involved in cell wall biosynthesis
MGLVGEVHEHDKPGFLGNPRALVFPIDWPEPLGLAMIEAMSCGTPVIAWDSGAVREIVDDGVTGFIVSSIAQAVRALREAVRMDRRRVRQGFEARFTAERMAQDYLRLYRRVVGARPAPPREEAVPLSPAIPVTRDIDVTNPNLFAGERLLLL